MAEAEEDDPLALIVAALRDATTATQTASAAAAAARAAAVETRNQIGHEVSGLAKQVDALAHGLQAMTPRRAALQSAREARYVWAAAGFIGGIILCAAFFFLAAARPHAG